MAAMTDRYANIRLALDVIDECADGTLLMTRGRCARLRKVADTILALQKERDALARENEAMRRCAIRYLEWLGVTTMPPDQALRDDMHNPRMCGDAALEQE